MLRSDEFFQLDQMLREAGEAGQALRLMFLRHFGELVRDLMHNLDTETLLHSPAETFDPIRGGVTDVNSAEAPVQAPDRIALSGYGMRRRCMRFGWKRWRCLNPQVEREGGSGPMD